MEQLVEKIWFFTASLCLVSMLSAFVISSGVHEVSEETKSEQVEFEKCEVIAERIRRSERREIVQNWTSVSMSAWDTGARLNPTIRCFKTLRERDHFNGFGGYLLT